MKKIAVLVTVNFILISVLMAQNGDFKLPGLQNRSYIKVAADSSLIGNGIRNFLIGKNYREEWTTPVEVPVLNFAKDFGGLTPQKEGGGKQTHTLHIKDGSGRDWVLRSVQKFPSKVIAPEMKGTVAETIVSDGISASYPYSVLSVGTLARASGVPYMPNTVVYIPDDPALGEFRNTYKNSLALLELRGPEDSKTYDTQEIIPELIKNNKKAVNQEAILRARLLDNFVMDFDRHEGQWVWTEKDSAGKKWYSPIPKDRDQALFKGDGFLIRKLSGMPSLGQLQGLKAKPKNILTFNYAARNFDDLFLNELDETTWSKQIDDFLSTMSDEIIDTALSRQPKEIQKYQAKDIAEILKKKKTSFKEDMMHYYRFISRNVPVLGTNDADVFVISKNQNGSLDVAVKNLNDSTITYKRTFDAATKEIRIYGLEGDDQFVVNEIPGTTKIRLIGGPGEDIFTNTTKGRKALVYDVSFENNTVSGRFKKKISSDPLNNEYQRINSEYNSSSIGVTPEYSRDGGLFLGLHYTAIKTGFRKEPYASRHFIYATKALTSPAWHLRYDADFMKIGRKTDLLFKSDAKLPTVRTHFFGYGNNTVLSKNIQADYYKIEYPLIEASLMARHSIAPWIQLSYGPLLQYFNLQPEKNEKYYVTSIHSPEDNIYGSKWYTGGEARVTINTKNSELIPTRGIYFNTYAKAYTGINENTNNFTRAGADFSLYTDVLYKKHIVFATAFGAHRNFGKFEIPQAQYLGFKQNLRGYRFQRFAGEARAYNNTELRFNFGDVNLYWFKGPVGVVAFHDVARVWTDGEDSDTWHTGYGGGFWIAPFKKLVLTGMITSSKEENILPMLIFGFQF